MSQVQFLETCPYCSSKLIDEESGGSINFGRDLRHIYYEMWCANCDIEFNHEFELVKVEETQN